jgi:hypothetical protein
MNLGTAKQNAQILGATHYRTYFTDTLNSFVGSRQPEAFSVHFFDSADEEVGMYSIDMGELCGMQVFDTPRVWSNTFKKHPNYSEPIDFRTSCVYHLFNKKDLVN